MSGIDKLDPTTETAFPPGELEKAPRRAQAPRRRASVTPNKALVVEAVQAATGPDRRREAHRLALEAEQSGDVRKLARAVRLMLEVVR